MVTEPVSGTQTLERAISLLSCFSEEIGPMRVSELTAASGLGPSTVSRMMSALERMRFVIREERTGLYQLGPAILPLGTTALNGSATFRAARQVAQNLAHTTDLGVNVAELNGLQLFYLCNFEGTQAPKSFSMAGRSGPLHATGMGKALMSGMPTSTLDAYFATDRKKFTPRTIVSREEMEVELSAVRACGYATEYEELAFGRACIGAPIRDRSGDVIAALSVSGPLSAMDLEEEQRQDLARTVIEAADEVSVTLGFRHVYGS